MPNRMSRTLLEKKRGSSSKTPHGRGWFLWVAFLIASTTCPASGCEGDKKKSPGRTGSNAAASQTKNSVAGPWGKLLVPGTRIEKPLSQIRPSPPKQKGVVLGLYSEDPHWSYLPLLREIQQAGASHVSLVVAYYLDTIYSHQIRSHPRYTAKDSVLVRVMKRAKDLNLEVLLFPILRVLEKPTPDHWRGNLQPKNPTKLQNNYLQIMGHLATLAQRHGAHSLSLGSELSTLDVKKQWFEPIVKEVRKRFDGRLIYSGNWDHFRKVKLWSSVDDIGVCGYFGLTSRKNAPPLYELVAGWRDHRAVLSRWAQSYKKKLIFTEVGYMSQRGTARAPWDEGARRKVDLEEQRRAYEAFVRVWNGAPQLTGAYFWNWYGWGGPKERP